MQRVASTLCLIFTVQLAVAQIAAVPATPTQPLGKIYKDHDPFVIHASQDGLASVALAKIAVEKTNDANLRQLADQVLKDRTAANDELTAIAAKKNLKVSSHLDSKNAAQVKQYRTLSGADLNTRYTQLLAQDQLGEMPLYRSEAGVADEELAAFAQKTLKVLEQHSVSAQHLAQRGAPGG